MMNSDDERDVDVESDEERRGGSKPHDKRAHHNALERKRRDHIKESFSSLRDAIPTMKGDKSSRAQILKSASEYINFMRQKQNSHSRDVDDLKRQNEHIEAQIKALERAKNSGAFSSAREVLNSNGLDYEVPAPTAAATADYAADEGAVGGGTEVSYVEQGGSGSDSNGSDSNVPSSRGATGGITVVQAGGRGQPQPLHRAGTTTTTVTVQPAGSQLRPIQPGQSLLIMSSAEPAKKKFKQ